MNGPFEMLGDPDAAACEGDLCALPVAPSTEPPAVTDAPSTQDESPTV